MANVDNIYASKYLKAADLAGRTHKLNVRNVEVEKLGDQVKIVIYFAGKEKGVVLNKTNAQMVKSAYGSDTDGWVGKTVEIRPDKVLFQSQMVDCIRVQIPAPPAPEGDESVPF